MLSSVLDHLEWIFQKSDVIESQLYLICFKIICEAFILTHNKNFFTKPFCVISEIMQTEHLINANIHVEYIVTTK